MGEVQLLSVKDLQSIVGEQAQWIKDLSEGVCAEEVAEKTVPKSCSAIKTFKNCMTLESLLNYLQLCCIDVIQKVKEHMQYK